MKNAKCFESALQFIGKIHIYTVENPIKAFKTFQEQNFELN